MKVTIEIKDADIPALKSYLVSQALEQNYLATGTLEKDRPASHARAEMMKDLYNAICDAQNWANHLARQKAKTA